MPVRQALGRIGLGGALVLAGIAAPVVEAGPAYADGAPPPAITDDLGRTLILHGLNTASSAKGPSGLPWIDRDDVAREARDMGTNSVRYLIQWKNVEPEPGRYDDAYLDAVAERVAWYREQGMHVILDMHQDVYGPAACDGAGNGAPAWATVTDGLPCTPQDPWVLTYVQPAVLRAFDNFWNHRGTHPELRQRYAAMWRHVAERFADEPAVLGYDLMNEPFGGTRHFGFFEGPVLTPFYQQVVDAIREVDANGWIFVEPESLNANQGAPSSLGVVADPRPGTPRIVFAPHFYPGGVDLGGSYDGVAKALVRAQFALWKRNMPAAARRLGTPMWLGEVGGMGQGASGAADFTRDWLAMADDLGIGWSYWSNDPGSSGVIDGGGGPTIFTGLLARPYARAIAGPLTAMSYSAGTLTVSWRTVPGVGGPTEIWFPSAPRITSTDPAGTWTSAWDETRHVLSVWADPGTAAHTVTVTP
ncbi:endoglycosylceramidase [Actinocorallia herbida]|uniref:Endoglycosylceramidase n=1 Tax=Actinocorallia herbida TaxID=58109 RepID=A0A3N1D0I9_9ACTN|nr:cellulase family glycosylhydrolase [Actinocorallia herbida]ROO87042.1 endoglycosylceramidase [Actinocorallia herbida]